MNQYSKHFSDKTDPKILNTAVNGPATPAIVANLTRVCFVLDPVREHFGVPFDITSGYRNPNRSIKGGSKTSAHKVGGALDFVPRVKNIFVVFMWIVAKCKFDQVIFETDQDGNNWIHLGVRAKDNRQMALVGHYRNGEMVYAPYVLGM